jgi:hypothetical protein
MALDSAILVLWAGGRGRHIMSHIITLQYSFPLGVDRRRQIRMDSFPLPFLDLVVGPSYYD